MLFAVTVSGLLTGDQITANAPAAQAAGTAFSDSFSTGNPVTNETGSMSESTHPNFWLNSGGEFRIGNGTAKTMQGNAPTTNRWYQAYKNANPLDTDGGLHPQNLFRFVTRSTWENYTQEAYFKINKDNFSSSPNRDGHNGILLFNRYHPDGQTLYYTGLRVDGKAVIKKKLNGTYYTMAMSTVYPGTYSRSANSNLLPHNTWIGLRSVVQNNAAGGVDIKLYTDEGRTGTWRLVLSTTDNSSSYGTAIKGAWYAGIRTDFMDIEFDDYRIGDVSTPTPTPSPTQTTTPSPTPTQTVTPTPTPAQPKTFTYDFRVNGVLDEAANSSSSWSPFFWLTSGGQMYLKNGVGMTIQGMATQKWRNLYAASNPVDTDNGQHPQNIFRVLTKALWRNATQQIYFKINKVTMSDSPNRTVSNGLMLVGRAQANGDSYYAGIRVDGNAVIKKKIGSTYHTIAQQPLFISDAGYDRDTNPNLIPGKRWIGVQLVTTTNADGTVALKLLVDKNNSGVWTLAAQGQDDGRFGTPLGEAGNAGIKTDFMDVEFDNYKIVEQ